MVADIVADEVRGFEIAELLEIVKQDDETALASLAKYPVDDLKTALTRLSEPIKLSFTQKMIARTFGIDVTAEQTRFLELLNKAIALQSKTP